MQNSASSTLVQLTVTFSNETKRTATKF